MHVGRISNPTYGFMLPFPNNSIEFFLVYP